jgi:hypothetical protein
MSHSVWPDATVGNGWVSCVTGWNADHEVPVTIEARALVLLGGGPTGESGEPSDCSETPCSGRRGRLAMQAEAWALPHAGAVSQRD